MLEFHLIACCRDKTKCSRRNESLKARALICETDKPNAKILTEWFEIHF